MEIVSLLVKLIVCMTAQLVSNTAAQSDDGTCPIWYTTQPPTELKCNPLGTFLNLHCDTSAKRSVAYSVTWYWSRCAHDAGIKGTAILLEDNRDAYWVDWFRNYDVIKYYTHDRLFFRVTDSTLGYYWCEISSNTGNMSFRPSLITPVLQPTNKSLPECMLYDVVFNAHNRHQPECAAKDSPTIYKRAPLPSFCSLVVTNTNDATTVLLIVYAVCATLIILVLVLLVFGLCKLTISRNRVEQTYTLQQVSVGSGNGIQEDATTSANELAMEQNEAYTSAQNRELEMEQNEAYTSAISPQSREEQTSATCPQSRELEMEQNSLNEALSVDTQNKDILVERNAAYHTVVNPQTDEGDYEIII